MLNDTYFQCSANHAISYPQTVQNTGSGNNQKAQGYAQKTSHPDSWEGEIKRVFIKLRYHKKYQLSSKCGQLITHSGYFAKNSRDFRISLCIAMQTT